MVYTVLFIAALIFVSGFVAYFGDLLGRRMGKKRLSLFNMRPRHTAIVVTTITGMLISALALVTLGAISPHYRQMLMRGASLLSDNKELTAQNSHLSQRNINLLKKSKDLEWLVATRQKEVERARKDAVKAKADLAKAQLAVTRLEKDIEIRKKDLAELRKRKDFVEAELARRTQSLHLVEAELSESKHDLSTARANLKSMQSRLASTQKELDEAEKMLAEQKKAIEILSQEHRRVVALSEAGSEFAVMLRWSDFALRQGDELARGAISSDQSSFAVKSDIYSLLDKASAKAAESGAHVGSNGRAVRVIYRQIVNEKQAVYIDDENKCIGMALDKIVSPSNSSEDILVQVVVGMNALEKEQVPVELRLYINYLVYKPDNWIAGVRIDGRLSEGRILGNLIEFMQNDLSRAALKAGIIPISNPGMKSTVDKHTSEQLDVLMDVVDKIKADNKPVNVDVYALANIRAANTLNMDNMRFAISSK